MITQRLGWETIQEALSEYRGQIHKDRGEPIHVAIVVRKRFDPTFKRTFGDFRATRARLDSVVDARNRLAHGEEIDDDAAEFALIAMEWLLRAAELPEVEGIQAIRRTGSVRQGERLEWLARKYEGSALEKKSVGNRDRGFRDKDDFLRKYPFREPPDELPETIRQRIRTREDIYDFLALIRALWPLGSIGQLNLDEAAGAAAAQIERFRDLLELTFGSKSVAEKIDAWNIPQLAAKE